MKKIIIFLAIILCIPFLAQAQSNPYVLGSVAAAASCTNDTSSELNATFEDYNTATNAGDGITWTNDDPVVTDTRPAGALNSDSCGSYHLAFIDMLATGINWVFGDMAIVYATGWVKVSDAGPGGGTPLADDTDSIDVISFMNEAGEICMRIRLTNYSGTLQYDCEYYDNGTIVGAGRFNYVDEAVLYFKMFYSATASDILVSIGASPASQTELVNSTTLTSPRSVTGKVYLGIQTSTGYTTGALDMEFDSIAIDNSTYDRTEYK